MASLIRAFLASLLRSGRDLTPIIGVIAFFQLLVLQQALPQFTEVVLGTLLVVVGLTLFIYGLEMGLFPIGESMAHAFARKGSIPWLLTFAFALGFSTTIAEPALIAVAGEAGRMAAQTGVVMDTPKAIADYALGLRLTVALEIGRAHV